MSIRMRIAVALALAGAAAGMAFVPPPFGLTAQTIDEVKRSTPQPRPLGRGSFANWHSHISGPGWTAAHVKRMAQKRRNRARNKMACRSSNRRGL